MKETDRDREIEEEREREIEEGRDRERLRKGES